MNKKELLISILNNALKAFQDNGGKLCPGAIVVDYNIDTVKIASYIDRHPGWIKLYVTLKEGTGLFFIKCKTTILGNIYYLAWEEDDNGHGLLSLYEFDDDALFNAVCIDALEEELGKIITIGLL